MITQDGGLPGTTILVTGGTGFVGSGFVRHAVEAGARVTVASRQGSDPWRLAGIAGRYVAWNGALASLRDERTGAGPVDVVVHFAASGVDQRFDDVRAMVDTNVVGTLEALEYASGCGARRFVMVGTSGEYGPGVGLEEHAPLRPTSEYGASRAAATLLARAFGERRGLDVVVVRPFAVFGPFEAAYRLVPYAILQGLAGKEIALSSGVQTRDYVHVDDVARGIAMACQASKVRGQVVNLCTGVETSVGDVATMLATLTGEQSTVAVGARPDMPGEMWRTTGSPALSLSLLGWTPRWQLAAGLADTVRWFQQTGVRLHQYHGGA
ncbi:MAG: NAD(P)-dependent oxidoreductase [Gemmatimonadota bacterium]